MTKRIFQFTYPNKLIDWVFTPTIDCAISTLTSITGNDDYIGIEIEEVPKEEWDNHNILDMDGNIEETFEEYAKRNTFSDIIATTAF